MASVPITDKTPRRQYDAAAAQAIFVYDFVIFGETELDVYLTPVGDSADDTTDILILNIDYTVTGVNQPTGGTIVLTVAATLNDRITLIRDQNKERISQFLPGDFTEEAMNDALNTQVMYAQENEMFITDLSPKYARTALVEPGQIILPQLGAGQVWKSNLLGTGIIAQDFTTTDLNTLRTDLANETQFNDGALIVGYFDVPFAVGETTVHDAIDKNSDEIIINTTAISANFTTLQNEINAIKDRESSAGVLLGGGFSENPFQSGTAFTNIADGVYVADGWKIKTNLATGKIKCDRKTGQDSALGGVYSNVYLGLECTTAQAVIGAAEYIALMQPVEGAYAQSLYLKNMLYSLNVDSLTANTFCIAMINKAHTESYVTEINVTIGWTRISKQINAFVSAAGWEDGSDEGIELWIVLAAGTNYQTTADAWQAGFFFSTTNQTNFVATLTRNLDLDLIKLEADIETDFVYRGTAETLAFSLRYYEQSYSIGVVPGTATAIGSLNIQLAGADSQATYCQSLVTKRIIPAMTYYNSNTGAIDRLYNGDTGVSHTVTSVADVSANNAGIPVFSPAGASTNFMQGQFTADARY